MAYLRFKHIHCFLHVSGEGFPSTGTSIIAESEKPGALRTMSSPHNSYVVTSPYTFWSWQGMCL